MIIRQQKNMYELSPEDETKLTSIVLAAINEITKSDPSTDNRYDVGIDVSNIIACSPYTLQTILEKLGYEYDVDNSDTNGWQIDYWYYYKHTNNEFPKVLVRGTAITHECLITGVEDDDNNYKPLENNTDYNDKIKKGYDLLNKLDSRA